MKKLLLALLAILLLGISEADAYEVHYITRAEAIEIVKRQFQGRDVDYYILNDPVSAMHTFFVDAEPMKGWEHECYIVTVGSRFRLDSGITLENYQPTINELRLPPEGDFRPLDVKNRYGDNAVQKPTVAQTPSLGPGFINDKAKNTYAIIINGGYRPTSNYERYWNDCSFIYQTLRYRYQIPKTNIYPLMSDGLNLKADMITNDGELVSQRLDLDGDGFNEIQLAATRQNIQLVLQSLENVMKENDHLFIYIIDHGSLSDNGLTSNICLWNGTMISDTDFTSMLDPLLAKSMNISLVMGQCFSGGFVRHLSKKGCVVATASRQDEMSWACTDIPYDEFVYRWTCAVNGADHRFHPVNADVDGNGIVTMEEAFNYAKATDVCNEHPQYLSTPNSIGEDLAFNNINEPIDLYIRDNPEDTGKEPNLTTELFWKSPSIWIRNQNDWVEEHENPQFSDTREMVNIYVKVHNRGKADYKIDENTKYLHLFWAASSTAICEETWKGKEVDSFHNITGHYFEPKKVPSIAAGDSVTMRIMWTCPDISWEEGQRKVNFCLLAKINDKSSDDNQIQGELYSDVLAHNDIAQKNVIMVKRGSLNDTYEVAVRNPSDSTQSFTLEVLYKWKKESFFARNDLELQLSPGILQAWSAGGMNGYNINYVAPRAVSIAPGTVVFKAPNAKMENLLLLPRAFDKVGVKFVFKEVPANQDLHSFDIIQRDATGKIIGGQTFIVEPPQASSNPMSINVDDSQPGIALLSVDDNESATTRWYDREMNMISEQQSLSVNVPRRTDAVYSAVTINDDGELAGSSAVIEASCGIRNTHIDNEGRIVVEFKNPTSVNCSLILYNLKDNSIITKVALPDNSGSYTIDNVSLPHGLYLVSYTEDGELTDSAKFTI